MWVPLERKEVPEPVFEEDVFEPGTFPTRGWEVLPVRVGVVPYIAYFDYEFPFDLSDDDIGGSWTALGNAL